MIFSKFIEYRFRILAGVLLAIFLTSTWFLFLQQPKYPEELHVHLQDQLKVLIKNRLYKSGPALTNDLAFHSVHTEATKKEGQLKAHFKYSFTDKQRVKTIVQGTAIIYRRSLEASDDHELWVLTDFQINSTLLDFEEPVTLLPISQGRGKLLEAVDSDLGEGDRRLEPDTAVIEEADGESIDEEESSSWENSDTQPKEVVSEKEKIIEEGSLKDSDEIVQMKKGNKEKEGDDEKEKDSSLAGENSHSNDDTKPVEINVKKTDVEEETRSHPEKSSQPATQGNSVKEVDDTIEEENVDSDNTENNPGAVNPVTE